LARRLEDGRIQVDDGRIFDRFQVQMIIMSALLGDDEHLHLAAEILNDCPGPKGSTGPFYGPCARCGAAGPHEHPAERVAG